MTETLNLYGQGIKGKEILSRWNEKEWKKLSCLIIEDVDQSRNMEYLLQNSFNKLIAGINYTLNWHNLDRCTVYLNREYMRHVDENIDKSIEIVYVDEAKKLIDSVFDGETLVHNAETLVQIGKVLLDEDNTQKKIMTLTGDVNKETVVEVPFGLTLREIIDNYADGVKENQTIKFVQVGGSSGSLYTENELGMKFEYNELLSDTAMLEIGKIEVFHKERCVVDWAMKNARVNNNGTCGKCVLCREGFYQIHKILKDATQGKSKDGDLSFAKEISEKINSATLCDYGVTASKPISDAIEKFGDEFDKHIERKMCPTLTCNAYSNFYVDPSTCVGCGECIEVCGANAIRGGENMIHIIDMDSCERCGRCETVCKNSAIKRYGTVKPNIPLEIVAVGSFDANAPVKKGLGVSRRRRRKS